MFIDNFTLILALQLAVFPNTGTAISRISSHLEPVPERAELPDDGVARLFGRVDLVDEALDDLRHEVAAPGAEVRLLVQDLLDLADQLTAAAARPLGLGLRLLVVAWKL